MAIEIIISTALNGRPTLSVKGFNAKEVYQTACRVNAYLDKACPHWRPYENPAKRDISNAALFYCVVPLQYQGWAVPVEAINALFAAMQKAGIEFECSITDSRYILVEEEIEDLVSLADVSGFSRMTKQQLEDHCVANGVMPPVRMTKQQLKTWMEEVMVPVH